jgi:hypothetical protein
LQQVCEWQSHTILTEDVWRPKNLTVNRVSKLYSYLKLLFAPISLYIRFIRHAIVPHMHYFFQENKSLWHLTACIDPLSMPLVILSASWTNMNLNMNIINEYEHNHEHEIKHGHEHENEHEYENGPGPGHGQEHGHGDGQI